MGSTVVKFSKPLEANELASMIRMLPPLPEVANKILEKFGDEFISGNEIADIVECDPAVSARLFGLANSAYFGLSTPVTAMREVVSRVLGPDSVRSLAFALATEQMFDLNDCELFDSRRFWHRSLYSAAAAGRIAAVIEDVDPEVAEFAYLTGMCHSLGVLALACCYAQKTSLIFRQFDGEEEADFNQLCVEQFGFSVDDVTYELALHWGMPDPVIEAYRRRASKEIDKNLLAAVTTTAVKAARHLEFSDGSQGGDSIDVPDFSKDLPYVETSLLLNASMGTEAQRTSTQSRLQAIAG